MQFVNIFKILMCLLAIYLLIFGLKNIVKYGYT